MGTNPAVSECSSHHRATLQSQNAGKKNEPFSGQSCLLGWGGRIFESLSAWGEGTELVLLPTTAEVDLWQKNKPWTWSMKGYRLFQDIETWHFPCSLPWQTLTKIVQGFRNKKEILQDCGCHGSFMLKSRKKISTEDALSASEAKIGERLRNEAWAPTPGCLCAQHQVKPHAPLLTAQEGGQSWLCSPTLPREEGNAPMHYI